MGKAEDMLNVLKTQYGEDPNEVLRTIARQYLARPEEVILYLDKLPEITPEDLMITLREIEKPNPMSRFIWEPNQVTVYSKNGDIESEPKDWIKFGAKWYYKPDIIKK
jgi:hypothetical protein